MRVGRADSRISGLAAQLLLGAVVVLVLVRSGQAIRTSVTTAAEAAGHLEESLVRAQDRLFGREYMQSIRRVESLTSTSATLFLIDGQTSERGANYFLVYFLSPRELVRIGIRRKLSARRLARNIPEGEHWLLISRDEGMPVEIRKAGDYKLELERVAEASD